MTKKIFAAVFAAVSGLSLLSAAIFCAVSYSFQLSAQEPLPLREYIYTIAVYLVLYAVIALLVSAFVAMRLSKVVFAPIADVDVTRPEAMSCYPEYELLSQKLCEQNNFIYRTIEELNRKQTQFSTITDNMNEGILVLSVNADILSYNKSVLSVLNISKQPPKNFTAIESDICVKTAVREALLGNRWVENLKISEKCYEVIANPVIHEGVTEGAVVIFIDRTEREQREALRRQFTSNISHELKTPLTSISGFAEIIAGGLAEGDEKRFASCIYDEAQRLIVLVGDIIKLNRLDGGEIPFDTEPVDLCAVCRSVCERLEVIAQKAKVTISFSGEKATIRGNERIVEEIVYNLADNAIKYNNEGGSVWLSVLRENGKAEFSCRDNGIGISKEHQQRIFERFYRVDKSRSKSGGGTGLGLSIVKHSCAYLNAEISLTSSEGKGSCVVVSFPDAEA